MTWVGFYTLYVIGIRARRLSLIDRVLVVCILRNFGQGIKSGVPSFLAEAIGKSITKEAALLRAFVQLQLLGQQISSAPTPTNVHYKDHIIILLYDDPIRTTVDDGGL